MQMAGWFRIACHRPVPLYAGTGTIPCDNWVHSDERGKKIGGETSSSYFSPKDVAILGRGPNHLNPQG